jgi:putative DNA primase/helicase
MSEAEKFDADAAVAKLKVEAVAAAEKAAGAAKQEERRKEWAAKTTAKTATMNGVKTTGLLRSSGRGRTAEVVELKPAIEEAESKVDVDAAEIAADLKPKGEAPVSPDLSLQGRASNLSEVKFAKTIAALNKLGVHFSYDLFRRRYRVGSYDLELKIGESIDSKILVLRSTIMYRFGFDPKEYTQPAVFRLCLEHAFNPVLDYLDGLKWDGKPRLDTWLINYLSAVDEPLNRAFGRKVLVAAVRRARKPGCKFDNVMVLEGEQNLGKSTVVKILAGEYFRDDGEVINKSGREVQELISGVWLYEMSELVGLGKREAEHVKAFLSRTHDSARGAWGRMLEDQPRTCVFIGTCNRNDYLSDDTGNRRFWPVPVGKIDLEALQRDRDQLWAEANMAEATGEPLVLKPELWGDAAMLAASRLADDPWDQTLAKIERWPVQVDGKFSREFGEWRASSDWLLRDVLDLNPNSISGASSKRLAACMRRLGWTGPKNLKINGQPDQKGYCRSLQALLDWR